MYQLYYCRGKASLTPHMLLEELGVPYQLVAVDVKNNQHKSAEYLTLNPAGKIPLLVDGDTVIAETAAICLYLVDKHPQRGLAPRTGTAERGAFYQWMFYLSTTLQPALMIYFTPQSYSDEDPTGVRQKAYHNIAAMLDLVENRLLANQRENRGAYLLGSNFSAVDLLLLMLARWTSDFDYPARDRRLFGEYLQRVAAREGVKRAFESENIIAPYY